VAHGVGSIPKKKPAAIPAKQFYSLPEEKGNVTASDVAVSLLTFSHPLARFFPGQFYTKNTQMFC